MRPILIEAAICDAVRWRVGIRWRRRSEFDNKPIVASANTPAHNVFFISIKFPDDLCGLTAAIAANFAPKREQIADEM